jgi:three-Cys-motif partner protein
MSKLPLSNPQDDGLVHYEVGAWAETKHSLVGLYDRLFSTGMKNKWDSRVYIELYAGPGLLRIRGTNRFIWGSPFHALGVQDPFDKYIFCDSNVEALDALKRRVETHFPDANAAYIVGSCDEKVEDICREIPKFSGRFRVLSFCFADPTDISIKFATVKKLAQYFVDFLFLLALDMDANRARQAYLDPNNTKIDDFLGEANWRQRWEQSSKRDFRRFLAEEYAKRMATLGYIPLEFEKMKQVRADDNNRPLYRLALFSKHKLAYKYWDDVLKYSTSQLAWDWDQEK